MITVEVCIGSTCHLKGAYEVINIFETLVKENFLNDQAIIKGAFCLGHCTKAVSVRINRSEIYSVHPENAREFFEEQILNKVELCRL